MQELLERGELTRWTTSSPTGSRCSATGEPGFISPMVSGQARCSISAVAPTTSRRPTKSFPVRRVAPTFLRLRTRWALKTPRFRSSMRQITRSASTTTTSYVPIILQTSRLRWTDCSGHAAPTGLTCDDEFGAQRGMAARAGALRHYHSTATDAALEGMVRICPPIRHFWRLYMYGWRFARVSFPNRSPRQGELGQCTFHCNPNSLGETTGRSATNGKARELGGPRKRWAILPTRVHSLHTLPQTPDYRCCPVPTQATAPCRTHAHASWDGPITPAKRHCAHKVPEWGQVHSARPMPVQDLAKLEYGTDKPYSGRSCRSQTHLFNG